MTDVKKLLRNVEQSWDQLAGEEKGITLLETCGLLLSALKDSYEGADEEMMEDYLASWQEISQHADAFLKEYTATCHRNPVEHVSTEGMQEPEDLEGCTPEELQRLKADLAHCREVYQGYADWFTMDETALERLMKIASYNQDAAILRQTLKVSEMATYRRQIRTLKEELSRLDAYLKSFEHAYQRDLSSIRNRTVN